MKNLIKKDKFNTLDFSLLKQIPNCRTNGENWMFSRFEENGNWCIMILDNDDFMSGTYYELPNQISNYIDWIREYYFEDGKKQIRDGIKRLLDIK
jgi:hypothetical protein